MNDDHPTLDWRAYLAEAIASFAFAFLATASIATTMFMGATGAAGVLALGLTQGLALAGAIAIARPVSGGHVNPVFTVGALVAGRLAGHDAIAYVVAQLVGAAIGILFAGELMPVEAIAASQHGAVQLGPGVETGRAIGLSLVGGTLLGLVWHGSADRQSAPVVVGLSLATLVFVTAALVGNATNPATALGAGWFADWPDGTFSIAIGASLGGVLAGSVWRFLNPDAAVATPAQ